MSISISTSTSTSASVSSNSAEAKIPAEIAEKLVDPETYARPELHETYRWLRDNNPLGYAEIEGFDPFWVVVKHEDLNYISRNNALFHSADRATVITNQKTLETVHKLNGTPHLVRSLVQMDAPDHSKHRRLTQAWFLPRNLETIKAQVDALADNCVSHMAGLGGKCDFVQDVALNYPLSVIMSILGLPEEDFPRMLMLTQQLFGASDPDTQRQMEEMDPEDATNMVRAILADYDAYFKTITAARRENPTGDLSTLIANAEIDGKPMADYETLGYYIIVATAGHDTTSSSTSCAMWALATQEGMLEELKAKPELIPNLVEESIRWETPVKTFMRSATEDTEIRGRKIAKGEWIMLCYASANRDGDVIPNPDVFDINRPETKKQIAFGGGAHVCIGQHLARLEMTALFEKIIPRLKSVKLAGEPAHIQSTFVNGLKSLPIEFEMN